jgi:hypothetical protein
MLNCVVFLNVLDSKNRIYLNLLNSNKNLNLHYHILGTNIIYNKKVKLDIHVLDDISENFNIDFVIIKMNNNYIHEMNQLINKIKIMKVLYCFTNVSLELTNDRVNYLRLHNNCEISYIYKTLQLNNRVIKTVNQDMGSLTTQKISKDINISKDLSNFSEICMSFLECLEDVHNKQISENSIYEAVYIEFRELKHSEFIIKNCVIKLNEKWSHTVICCNDNYHFTLNVCNKINKNIKIIKLDITNATYNDYNNLLLTKEFWNMLKGEKILIYQSDSLLFNMNIDDFLHYDYIGTPLLNKACILAKSSVGNGGLSLRTKKVMLDVLNHPGCDKKYSKIAENFKLRAKFDKIPEDIYFSQNIQNLKLGLVADEEAGKKFGFLNKYDNCFGMHAIWHLCGPWKSIIENHMKNNLVKNGCKDNVVSTISVDKEVSTISVDNNSVKNDDSSNSSLLNLNKYTSKNEKDQLYLNKMSQFCEIMNTTQNNVLSNPKQEFRYFCYRHLDYIRMIDLPIIPVNCVYEAVLIEFRCFPHLEFLIRNCINKLGVKWSQTIVCGQKNYNYILDIVKNINRNIKIIKLEYDNLTQNEYNNLLLTKEFWVLFVGEKLLIYQEDTCIFKSNIDDFLKWDYIGAPWPLEYNISKSSVGNGGFSLRSKKVMLECLKYNDNSVDLSKRTSEYIKENGLNRIPEDVFFSNIIEMHSIGKISDHKNAQNFSSESIKSNSLGGHQFWMNNSTWKNSLCKYVTKTFVPTCNINIEHRGGWSNLINKLYQTNLYNVESDVVFYDIVEKDFIWSKTVLNKKWFGVIHCTEKTPDYLDCVNIQNLFKPNSHFLKNIHNCLFLIGLSPNVVDYVKTNLSQLGIELDVYLLKHPIDNEENIPMFSIDKYKENNDKKIIQIGQQLRKMTSIYELNINDHKKLWLTGTKNFAKIKYLFYKECNHLKLNVNINNVEMKYTNSFAEYDNLLSENIVFIDLFDAAANNTVLECILRRTPIIVNRLPATEYYLGKGYPLFFDNINEVPTLLTIKNIIKAHKYLNDIKLSDTNNFISSIVNILNNKLK